MSYLINAGSVVKANRLHLQETNSDSQLAHTGKALIELALRCESGMIFGQLLMLTGVRPLLGLAITLALSRACFKSALRSGMDRWPNSLASDLLVVLGRFGCGIYSS